MSIDRANYNSKMEPQGSAQANAERSYQGSTLASLPGQQENHGPGGFPPAGGAGSGSYSFGTGVDYRSQSGLTPAGVVGTGNYSFGTGEHRLQPGRPPTEVAGAEGDPLPEGRLQYEYVVGLTPPGTAGREPDVQPVFQHDTASQFLPPVALDSAQGGAQSDVQPFRIVAPMPEAYGEAGLSSPVVPIPVVPTPVSPIAAVVIPKFDLVVPDKLPRPDGTNNEFHSEVHRDKCSYYWEGPANRERRAF